MPGLLYDAHKKHWQVRTGRAARLPPTTEHKRRESTTVTGRKRASSNAGAGILSAPRGLHSTHFYNLQRLQLYSPRLGVPPEAFARTRPRRAIRAETGRTSVWEGSCTAQHTPRTFNLVAVNAVLARRATSSSLPAPVAADSSGRRGSTVCVRRAGTCVARHTFWACGSVAPVLPPAAGSTRRSLP